MARKKPTIREVEATANEAMQRTEILKTRMINLEIVLNSYLEFKGEGKELEKFFEKKSKELSKTRTEKDLDNK